MGKKKRIKELVYHGLIPGEYKSPDLNNLLLASVIVTFSDGAAIFRGKRASSLMK